MSRFAGGETFPLAFSSSPLSLDIRLNEDGPDWHQPECDITGSLSLLRMAMSVTLENCDKRYMTLFQLVDANRESIHNLEGVVRQAARVRSGHKAQMLRLSNEVAALAVKRRKAETHDSSWRQKHTERRSRAGIIAYSSLTPAAVFDPWTQQRRMQLRGAHRVPMAASFVSGKAIETLQADNAQPSMDPSTDINDIINDTTKDIMNDVTKDSTLIELRPRTSPETGRESPLGQRKKSLKESGWLNSQPPLQSRLRFTHRPCAACGEIIAEWSCATLTIVVTGGADWLPHNDDCPLQAPQLTAQGHKPALVGAKALGRLTKAAVTANPGANHASNPFADRDRPIRELLDEKLSERDQLKMPVRPIMSQSSSQVTKGQHAWRGWV